MSGQAYATAALQVFAAALYRAAGMDGEKAAAVARLQVLTDAMGRATHGLAMAPLYLSELAKGTMTATGEPVVVHARGVTAVWDGHYLPGLWLVERALHQGMALAADQGMAAVAIRRSHHIGCLAALVKQAADQGFIAQIHNSDPAGQRVAPFGGTEALFTPNPTAIGYPGPDHPVLVDTCASITTTSMTRQKFAEGQLFDQPWLLDAEGQPTRDPAVLEHREPRGSLQLVGGQDHGHKGFGMALMIEALSQGLSGHGRKDAPGRCGGEGVVQGIDSPTLARPGALLGQTGLPAERCRANRPIDPARPVRLPGDQAAAGIALAARDGVHYPDLTWNALIRWAEKLGVPLPDPLPEIPR